MSNDQFENEMFGEVSSRYCVPTAPSRISNGNGHPPLGMSCIPNIATDAGALVTAPPSPVTTTLYSPACAAVMPFSASVGFVAPEIGELFKRH